MFRSPPVEALAERGRLSEARTLDEANTALCRQTGDRCMEPECLRPRGARLAADGANAAKAAQAFPDAIRLAKEHDARSWRLRVTTSLASLLIGRGRETDVLAIPCPAP